MTALTCPNCHKTFEIGHKPLTRKQAQIFRWIESFIRANGSAPSLSEIAVEFRLATVATVHEHLHNLQRRGVLRRGPGPRNITLLVRGDELGELPSTATIAPTAAGTDYDDDDLDGEEEPTP
jgi:repressor LexA